jgi:hypothetical protein
LANFFSNFGIEKRQKAVDYRLTHSDSIISVADNVIRGISNREKNISESLSLRGSDLDKLMERITEINSKNMIQQNIYIVDNLEYTYNTYWEYKKYFYKELLTNTGQRLPVFKKPPFIFPVSNEGFTFSIEDVNAESFELIPSNNSSPKYGDLKKLKATLFITENP